MTALPAADNRIMRNRLLFVLPAVVMFSTIPSRAQAQDHVAELGVMFWKPSPTITLSSDALAGTDINEVDFVEEFAIADKWFPEFRATLGRSHKFRFSYVNFKYDEEATIQRTFTFQGRTFTVGAPATANLDWRVMKIGYEWDFVSRPQGFFGVVAELKHNTVDAAVDSPVLRNSASAEVTAPVPTIGVAGRAYASGAASFGGEFTGLKLDREEFNVKFYDFDVHAAFTPTPNFGAQVGYRSITADYIIDEDTGDLKMQGPYIGAIVRF
jgi:hypothetical protein